MPFHGRNVRGPASKWRKDIVPRAIDETPPTAPTCPQQPVHHDAADDAPPKPPERPNKPRPRTGTFAPLWLRPRADEVDRDPRALTDAHRRRLDGGRLLATSPRLDWAKLLRRTYAVDVLVCPHCHGPTRIVAAITDPAVIGKILEHVREPPARAPPSGARDPDDHAVDEPAWLVSPRSTSKAERATMRGRGGHSPTPRRPPAEPRPRRGCGRSERPQRDPASVLVELRGCYVMSTRPLESVGDGLHFLP